MSRKTFWPMCAAPWPWGADMLRFYPCLVLAGTELARRWQQGLYTPLAPAAHPLPAGARLAGRPSCRSARHPHGPCPRTRHGGGPAGRARRQEPGRARAGPGPVASCLRLPAAGAGGGGGPQRNTGRGPAGRPAGGRGTPPAGCPGHGPVPAARLPGGSSAGPATSWAGPGRPWASRAAPLSGRQDRPPACILMPDPLFPPTCGPARIPPRGDHVRRPFRVPAATHR